MTSPAEFNPLDSQANWLAMKASRLRRVAEHRVYSDATFVGDFTEGLGPYGFMNTIAHAANDGTEKVRTSLILRIKHYLEFDPLIDWSKTDTTRYHGGLMSSELVDLASLALGVRLQGSGECRWFETGEDPYGRPIEIWGGDQPHFRQTATPIVPGVVGQRNLSVLEILKTIVVIPPEAYVELVRASRLYSEALWLTESAPNLSWLLLVSAIETAAGCHDRGRGDPETRLRTSKPNLVTRLEATKDPNLVADVAKQLEDSLGATKKFIQFIVEFLPDPPSPRPKYTNERINWTPSGIKKIANKIYSYRSKALHAAIPFPSPMLSYAFSGREGPQSPRPEHPSMGGGMSAAGGVWKARDLPITLDCFHNIVRGSLLNWWRSLAPDIPTDQSRPKGGIRCPTCGGVQAVQDSTVVVKTFVAKGHPAINRRRVCRKCGGRFNTCERGDGA